MKILLKKHLRHINHLYLPVSLVIIGLSFLLRGDPQIQLNLLIMAVFLYLSFSFIHHFLDKSLTLEVIIEYILIAWLSIVLLIGLLG